MGYTCLGYGVLWVCQLALLGALWGLCAQGCECGGHRDVGAQGCGVCVHRDVRGVRGCSPRQSPASSQAELLPPGPRGSGGMPGLVQEGTNASGTGLSRLWGGAGTSPHYPARGHRLQGHGQSAGLHIIDMELLQCHTAINCSTTQPLTAGSHSH